MATSRKKGKKGGRVPAKGGGKKQKPVPASMSPRLERQDGARPLVSPRLGFILLAVLCLALYVNTLNGKMVNWDDAIVTSAWKKRLSWGLVKKEFLTLRGTYQPLRNLSHVLDHEIFGRRLWGHRLHSILLYTGNVLLAYALLLFLLRRYPLLRGVGGMDSAVSSSESVMSAETAALFIAALFAAHPLHVEAVAWLSARKEVLFGLFYFTAMLLHVKGAQWKGRRAVLGYLGCWTCYLLSLVSKPAAASFPLVILAYDLILLRPPRKAWRTRFLYHLPFWMPLVGAVVYFAGMAGTTRTPWAMVDLYQRVLTSQKAMLKYAQLLFFPSGLSARYTMIPGRSLTEPAVFVGAILNLSMVVIFVRCLKARPLISFALAWFYLNWLPTSGLIPISTAVADRYMYLALLGFCMAAVALLCRVGLWFSSTEQGRLQVMRYGVVPFLIVVVGLLSGATVWRNRVWKEERLLWRDITRKSPSDLAFIHMAQYHLRRKEWKKAEYYFRQSLTFNPLQAEVWNNLGNLLVLQKRAREAEAAFKRALSLEPGRREVLKNLAMAYAMQNKFAQAEKSLTLYLAGNSKDYKAWDLLAQVRLARKDYEGLLQAARRMASLRSDKARAYVFMTLAFKGLGRKKKAEDAYQKALQLDPRLTQTLLKNLYP